MHLAQCHELRPLATQEMTENIVGGWVPRKAVMTETSRIRFANRTGFPTAKIAVLVDDDDVEKLRGCDGGEYGFEEIRGRIIRDCY